MPGLEWEWLSSEYVIEQRPWFTLSARRYRLPDGKQIGPYYMIEYDGWVTIVALTREQEVILVRQYRPGTDRVMIELPGGLMEADEEPEAAARRELLEETGYGGGAFICTGHVSPNPASHTNTMYCFLATGVERIQDPEPDATEHLETVLTPLDELVGLVKTSRLISALHISSLFHALVELGRIV